MNLERRQFLKLSAVAAAAGAMPGIWLVQSQGKPFLEAMLKEKLSYLDIESGAIPRFVDEFIKAKSSWLEFKSGLLGVGLNVFESVEDIKCTIGEDRFIELEHELAKNFLLSSDFFFNGANESTPVRYVRYYDAFNTACANPFARLTAGE